MPEYTSRYSPFYLLYGRKVRLAVEDNFNADKFVTTDGKKKCAKFRITSKGPWGDSALDDVNYFVKMSRTKET